MIYIYVFNYDKKDSLPFVKKALSNHTNNFDNIKRTEKGKPYIENDVCFSVSHSDNVLVCAIGKENLGIDIEKIRDTDCLKISKRFLNKELRTKEDFFKEWVRAESYVKYTGNGISTLPVSEEELSKVNTIYLDIKEGFVSALCTEKKEDIEIIKGEL